MQYRRRDVRHPDFEQYVASGEKARDVRAAMIRPLPERGDDRWMMDYLEQTADMMIRLQSGFQAGYVHVQRLSVPNGQRGHGIGEAVLRALCEVADRRGWTLTTTPSVDLEATSVARLERWLMRHGFVRNRGRRGYRTQAGWVRPPAKRA